MLFRALIDRLKFQKATMELHKRQNKGRIEIVATSSVDKNRFIAECAGKDLEIDPDSIKICYEKMRYEDKEIKFIECSHNDYGAYQATKGFVKKSGRINPNEMRL